MAKTPPLEKSKTILDLALQLGTRAEPVMQTMQALGLEPKLPTDQIDPGLEQTIIDQMVKQGLASEKLQKGKGLRKLSDSPIVDDDTLTEALGASESGFNESTIPNQIKFESSFSEKPSLWKRLFGSKNDLSKSLKEQTLSEDELNSLFKIPIEKTKDPLGSSFQEPYYSAQEESPYKIQEEVNVTTDLPDEIQEETDPEDDIELDESILSDISLDNENLDEINEEQIEEIENLDTISAFSDETLPDEIESDGALEELENTISEQFEESVPYPQEENKNQEEKPIPGFLEKIFSHIQLSPTETWTIMGFSIAVMLIVMAVTFSWWLYKSPEAQSSLLRKANAHYIAAQEEDIPWETQQDEWKKAIDQFTKFITDYGENPNIPEAFKRLCDSYYQLAKDSEKNGESQKNVEELYQKVSEFYKQYLAYLNKKAMEDIDASQANRADAYPDLANQQEALYRIADSYRKLHQYDIAIQKLKDFIQSSPSKEDKKLALKSEGDTYQEWAEVNKEQEPSLLEKAVETYKQLLSPNLTTPDNYEDLMRTYAKLGSIEKDQYKRCTDRNQDTNNSFAAQDYLVNAIGYYEKAVEYAKKHAEQIKDLNLLPSERKKFMQEKARIFSELADLYLSRGKNDANNWAENEKYARPYPDGVVYKQTLLDAANKAKKSTEDTIGKAQNLYNDILKDPTALTDDQHQNLLYNNTETHFILRDYPGTIAAGEHLLSTTAPLSDTIKAKTYYLMGHAAWELASEKGDGNYTKVKEYYREALKLDPFYGEKGNISHLAEIRLINSYFFVDHKYPQAIERFEEAVKRYPDSDYTYLTYFWYGQALEKYGDEITGKIKAAEQNSNPNHQDIPALRKKAKDLYNNAVIQYNNAIKSRDRSKVKDTTNKEYLIQTIFSRGHSAFKGGAYKEAKKYLTEALNNYRDNRVAQPYIPKAMETLGDINVLLANYGEAIRIYKDYLANSFDDNNARISMKLAEAYLNRYSYDKAREWYKRIASEYPPPTEKAVERSLRTNNPIAQGPGFEAMKKLADSYYREASSYSGEDRVKILNQALDAYKDLIKSYPLDAKNRSIPNDPDAQREIGNIYYELGSLSSPVSNYKQAVNNYQAFLASNTNYPRKGMIYYRIGQALIELQRDDQSPNKGVTYVDNAIKALSNINDTSMDNPTQFAQALILLGQAYEEKANYYLTNGDENLWNRYLEDAKDNYRRVAQTNIQDKMQEARTYINNINNRINSRNEVANIKP